MSNPPTPSFPVELEKHDAYMSNTREQSRKTRQVLKETLLNHGSVGRGRSLKRNPQIPIVHKWGWSPHLYRLYFSFDKSSFRGSVGGRLSTRNHDSEHHIENYHDCNIVIKKHQAEVTNLKHKKKYWLIYATTEEEAKERTTEICNLYDYECIEALKHFIKDFGGYSDLNILKRYKNDNAIKDEEFLKNIPEDLIYRDHPYSKKVYPDKTEVFSVQNTINFFRNRVIERVSPEIARELEEINKRVDLLTYIKEQILIKPELETITSLKDDIIKLSEEQREDLSLFIFKGVGQGV